MKYRTHWLDNLKIGKRGRKSGSRLPGKVGIQPVIHLLFLSRNETNMFETFSVFLSFFAFFDFASIEFRTGICLQLLDMDTVDPVNG